MVKRYVPDAGDLIWIDFDPVAGHEQGGHHLLLSLVLSPTITRLACCSVCHALRKSRATPLKSRYLVAKKAWRCRIRLHVLTGGTGKCSRRTRLTVQNLQK